MKYRHSFQIHAPLKIVADFHAHSSSMGAITPPPIITQIHEAPARLDEGDKMDFTLWLGPFPIRWLARIEDVSETGFADRQLRGPFTAWLHRHTFVPVDDQTTQVIDEIDYTLSSHLFWKVVGWGMGLNLPLLFAYRAWKTKRLLEKSRA
jgi:ligand-binding SRPBCC domain-containing protein